MIEYVTSKAVMDFEAARSVTKQYARTFYFTSHVLSKDKRQAAYALYGFCRLADEVVDSAAAHEDHHAVHNKIDELRNLLHEVYSPNKSTPFVALRHTVNRYNIPIEYFLDLLRGVEMDLHVSRIQNFEELYDYCYCVASVVGLMMTCVFGVKDNTAFEYAENLGTAMQLTNILRDVGEDFERGRIYLPLDELRQFNCDENVLKQQLVNDDFVRLMKFQIERAREYYKKAELGIPLVSNDGSQFCVRLMSTTYGRILDRIEKNEYDVFSKRAFVPIQQKIIIAVSEYFKTRFQ
ncbi:MAG: phytoene/squalene synthase family protein [Ignavibacteria bacterium]|nr:phytoene/squalene synthase family protein [Ignavibacteria bacterium]